MAIVCQLNFLMRIRRQCFDRDASFKHDILLTEADCEGGPVE